jgi:hypothetical protein
MCITTFLHDSELNVPTSNEELNKILKTVRDETKEDWQVIERSYVQRKIFKKPVVVKYFELYKWIGGFGPWQLINFYRANSETSINTENSADVVVSFLMGIRSGFYTKGAKNAS